MDTCGRADWPLLSVDAVKGFVQPDSALVFSVCPLSAVCPNQDQHSAQNPTWDLTRLLSWFAIPSRQGVTFVASVVEHGKVLEHECAIDKARRSRFLAAYGMLWPKRFCWEHKEACNPQRRIAKT